MEFLYALASLALLCVSASAQHLSQFCPSSDVCYQLNIPEATTKAGSGDIYFQIWGSTAYSWIGLGQGNQMAGANIFVMYADGEGNVTLSPRLGKGEFQPKHDTSAAVTLLEGSGVRNGHMVANVRCSNCASWSGGTMDFSSSSASWIFAFRSGSALDSTALNEGISIHSKHGVFTWDFTSAQGGADVNPFVNVSKSGTTTAVSPKPTSGPGGSGGSGGGGGGGGGSSSGSTTEESEPSLALLDMVVTAHGTLASVAFLVFFPLGAIILRIPGLPNALWIHAAIQIFAYCTFIAAAGCGIWAASSVDMLTDPHKIIGMLLLGLLFFEPFLGLVHHSMFKKKQQRTSTSHMHIWLGRILVILGMINGGLGLRLAQVASTNLGYVIAYSIVAGVMGVAFIGNAIYGETKKRREMQARSDQNGDVKE